MQIRKFWEWERQSVLIWIHTFIPIMTNQIRVIHHVKLLFLLKFCSLVRMRSPVRIWPSAPFFLPIFKADMAFLRLYWLSFCCFLRLNVRILEIIPAKSLVLVNFQVNSELEKPLFYAGLRAIFLKFFSQLVSFLQSMTGFDSFC